MDMELINALLHELDPSLECTSYELDGDVLRLFVHSTRPEVMCPRCGQPSAKRHSVYRKKFRDLPIMGKKVEIVISNRVMFCENAECDKATFVEQFPFIKPYARKTDRLWNKIMDVALNTSSVQAAATLRDGIADVSKSSICEREKQPPPCVDPLLLVLMGIDDWAKRKRETYGSIIVDLDTHRVIDLIDSRDKEAVSAHLKQYSNVVIACRDGSQSYRAAIADALPDAIQVSDFFHLVKGLTEAVRPQLMHLLPATITVSSNTSINPVWISDAPENAHERRRRLNEEKKAEQWRRIHELADAGYMIRAIAREFGISDGTVRRYLSADRPPVDARTGASNGRGEIAKYADLVCDLFEKGLPMTKIHEEIRRKGFHGGYYAVQNFIAREKRRRTAAAVQGGKAVIERKKALAMMYNLRKPPLTEEQVDAIAKEYTGYDTILDLVSDFRALFAQCNVDGLSGWLQKASDLDIPNLNSFVNGVKKDIEAVRAAIALGMTSGVVEGSVNKLKVAKRIMYGRCSFELLRGKLLLYEERKARRQASALCA